MAVSQIELRNNLKISHPYGRSVLFVVCILGPLMDLTGTRGTWEFYSNTASEAKSSPYKMQNAMEDLLAAIVADDRARLEALLNSDRRLATQVISKPRLYHSKIFHWMYAGDTALHLAAAGHRVEMAQLLLNAGADPNASANHRGSSSLHYAADGYVNGPVWDAKRQVKMIRCLVGAGANINLQDKNGATPLHRAVRTRCAAAVQYLLKAGSDPLMKNKPGSTPFHLAVQNTGRGGSGAPSAVAAQRQIIEEFLSRGLSPELKSSSGKTVRDWAQSEWIREMLASARRL